MSSPEGDKDKPGAGTEQEGRPSKAWGILIFGLVGAASATLAVSTAHPPSNGLPYAVVYWLN
jgi:hypothetical protein